MNKGNRSIPIPVSCNCRMTIEQALESMPGGEEREVQRPSTADPDRAGYQRGSIVYCPVCNKTSPITKEMLDKVIVCPQAGCKAPLQGQPVWSNDHKEKSMAGSTSRLIKADNRTKLCESLLSCLRREAHVLTSQPDLLWQQLYNRLQWEGGIHCIRRSRTRTNRRNSRTVRPLG